MKNFIYKILCLSDDQIRKKSKMRSIYTSLFATAFFIFSIFIYEKAATATASFSETSSLIALKLQSDQPDNELGQIAAQTLIDGGEFISGLPGWVLLFLVAINMVTLTLPVMYYRLYELSSENT